MKDNLFGNVLFLGIFVVGGIAIYTHLQRKKEEEPTTAFGGGWSGKSSRSRVYCGPGCFMGARGCVCPDISSSASGRTDSPSYQGVVAGSSHDYNRNNRGYNANRLSAGEVQGSLEGVASHSYSNADGNAYNNSVREFYKQPSWVVG